MLIAKIIFTAIGPNKGLFNGSILQYRCVQNRPFSDSAAMLADNFKGVSIIGPHGFSAKLVATQHAVFMFALTHNHAPDILGIVKSNFISFILLIFIYNRDRLTEP